MKLGEKLQILRKSRGLTQEELARKIYVSRTAVSKWESGRGMPGIDSLKAISEYFSVPTDVLLLDKKDLPCKPKSNFFSDYGEFLFAFMDLRRVLLFCLPVFAQRSHGAAKAVSILNFAPVNPAVKVILILICLSDFALGVAEMILIAKVEKSVRFKIYSLSVLLNLFTALCFIITLNPYAGVFSACLLIFKVLIGLKIKMTR